MRVHEHAHAHTNAYTRARAHAHGHTRTHVRAHTYTHEYLYSTYGSRCLYRYAREDPYLQVLMRICTHFSICLKLALSLPPPLLHTSLSYFCHFPSCLCLPTSLPSSPFFSLSSLPFLPSLFSAFARAREFVCLCVCICVCFSVSVIIPLPLLIFIVTGLIYNNQFLRLLTRFSLFCLTQTIKRSYYSRCFCF